MKNLSLPSIKQATAKFFSRYEGWIVFVLLAILVATALVFLITIFTDTPSISEDADQTLTITESEKKTVEYIENLPVDNSTTNFNFPDGRYSPFFD